MEKAIEKLRELNKRTKLVGLKMSTEDEGANYNEISLLSNIVAKEGLDLYLKIGGCEAKRDIRDANYLNVTGVVAPMVESVFALEKFIQNTDNSNDANPSWKRFINIETRTAYAFMDDILNSEAAKSLDGITFGRVDFVKSYYADRSKINDEEWLEHARAILGKTKQNGLMATMGGAVTPEAYDFLKTLYDEGLLDRFETRYVIFEANDVVFSSKEYFSELWNLAASFEYGWLCRKRDLYGNSTYRENKRIQMIKDRLEN